MKRLLAGLAVTLALAGCNAPAVTQDNEGAPAWSGRVWAETGPNAEPGAMIAFLPSGELVQTACFSPYRLSRWTRDAETVRWTEDGREIAARLQTEGETLTLDYSGDNLPEPRTFGPAEPDFACPDYPR